MHTLSHLINIVKKNKLICSKEMNKKEDVRIVKTRDRLAKALFQMASRKKLRSISISELCKKAEVNRNTFYSHYESVEALIDEIESNFIADIYNQLNISEKTTQNVTDLLISVLDVVKKNKEITSILLSDNGDKEILNKIVYMALPSAVENWNKELHIPKEKAELLYFFVQGGIVACIGQWVKSDFKMPVREMAENLNLMVLRGQSAFLFTLNTSKY